jgi:uncharacterized protein (DUF2336 family)
MESLQRSASAADASDRQIEKSLELRRANKRGRILREVVDLFLERPAEYTGTQLELFERVMLKLIDQVDIEVRAHLSERLAPGAYTPPRVAQHFASDDAIAVAGPMLSQSPCLDEDFLVASALTKSQQHLLAISSREWIGPRITDVLVDRGDRTVVMRLAANEGATFSDAGHSALAERARHDRELARTALCRANISRPQMLALVERASAAVREQLIAEDARGATQIIDVVREANRRLRADSQLTSEGFERARQRIAALQRSSGLSESDLLRFVHQSQFEEVVVALSVMSGLGSTDIERMLVEASHDRLLIVARALGLSWGVVGELVAMTQHKSPDAMERLRLRYLAIPRQTAIRTLHFHQLRARAQDGAA